MKYTLDGKEMTSLIKAHEHIAQALKFPGYYGKNFDALFDCLSEMKDAEITIINTDDIIENLGQKGVTLLGIFEDAADEGFIDLEM